MSDNRRHVHALVDQRNASQLTTVGRLLEAIVHAEPEAVTDEDRRRFNEGKAWFAGHGGKGIPMEDVLAEFGLKPEDFPLEN